jgi:hypothetical protein
MSKARGLVAEAVAMFNSELGPTTTNEGCKKLTEALTLMLEVSNP